MDMDEIANDLIEIRDMLETLAEEYSIATLDPLYLDPMEKINHILEEIE
jgi:hypothetical protein